MSAVNTAMHAASSNIFDWSRFVRVFRNDLAWQWKRLWIGSLAMAGIGLIIYLTNLDPGGINEPELFQVLFPLALIGGGMLFTAAIFADLHHPLQRFHYLTLPCSNLERFLSRYLLTGPLFFLFVLVGYSVFDNAAALLSTAWLEDRAAAFTFGATPVWQLSLLYFLMHATMLLGAVYFRSYALIKTGLVSTLIVFWCSLVQILALRLVFFEFFTSVIPDEAIALPAPLFARLPEITFAFGFLLHTWILYLAYATLCEHEVQE